MPPSLPRAERQDLIRQWDEALEAMRHRDIAVGVASEQFAMQKAELREKKAALDAQARFLEAEGLNNREVDARIAFYDREVRGSVGRCRPRARSSSRRSSVECKDRRRSRNEASWVHRTHIHECTVSGRQFLSSQYTSQCLQCAVPAATPLVS